MSLTQGIVERVAECGSAESDVNSAEQVYAELWISLAALLRSYTAVHGLSGNRVATIEADGASIVTRYEKKRLELRRIHAAVSWMRENGDSGSMELTSHGRLRETKANKTVEGAREEEMDMAAEAWARELMLEFEP